MFATLLLIEAKLFRESEMIDKNIIELIGGELATDIGGGDITCKVLIGETARAGGEFVAKQSGVVCGIEYCAEAFKLVSKDTNFKTIACDGDFVHKGDILATVDGNAKNVLSTERTALNILCRLSGVATLTHKFVEKVAGTGTIILDTRKTTPGLRLAEKYAVRCGGGKNHRIGLFDMILIKDNHIAALGGIENTIATLRSNADRIDVPVEIEVKNIGELEIALTYPFDRIMLDNFTPQAVADAMVIRSNRSKTIPFECSGGITFDTITDFAKTGVEYISIGALTHSAPVFDISLEIEVKI
jgi:nicotinate-nucleotide pyrophosphorylase (carboxylating)